MVVATCCGDDIRSQILGVLYAERAYTAGTSLYQDFFTFLEFAGVKGNDGSEAGKPGDPSLADLVRISSDPLLC